MSDESATPFEALQRIFHEPGRLAIVSALCTEEKGLTFSQLKETCRLTDGNLNRHLAALYDDGVVRMEKKFVGLKPRTTVFLTRRGLQRFGQYLVALEDVLKQARRAVPASLRRPPVPAGAKAAPA
jgi:DNA-binding transcriptional ArsR family regulator